ncbi:MAG: hypothetical protein ACU0AZ_01615 [Paracoccaceae bacterium]|jgi:hypothetical protein
MLRIARLIGSKMVRFFGATKSPTANEDSHGNTEKPTHQRNINVRLLLAQPAQFGPQY